ncbi:MAG: DUF4339 domain-containing protein [Bacteroidales bacterium]|nr:DUF4339 domain-containing protein [Bacteroidales bacterium]
MNKTFFIAVDGQQQGPFSIDDLRGLNVSKETLVWQEGWEEWQKAGDTPELAPLFRAAPPTPPTPPTPPVTTVPKSAEPPTKRSNSGKIAVIAVAAAVIAVAIAVLLLMRQTDSATPSNVATKETTAAVKQNKTADGNSSTHQPAAAKGETFSSANAAKIEKWKKEAIGNARRVSSDNFAEHDLSKFWKTEFTMGYIGNNYQRMYITFSKVVKKSAEEYDITGFSQVKANVCNFTGTFKNVAFFEDKWVRDSSVDDMYSDVEKRGFVIANFVLNEDQKQSGSGIFHGYLKTNWCIDTEGKFFIDNLGPSSFDTYNQFLGEWASYKTDAAKIAAWGDHRIPLAIGTLDIGDGEFVPDRKYLDNGWEEYKQYHNN